MRNTLRAIEQAVVRLTPVLIVATAVMVAYLVVTDRDTDVAPVERDTPMAEPHNIPAAEAEAVPPLDSPEMSGDLSDDLSGTTSTTTTSSTTTSMLDGYTGADPGPPPVCATILDAINKLVSARDTLRPVDTDLADRAAAILTAVQVRQNASPNGCVADYTEPCKAIPPLGADVLSSVGGNTDFTEAEALAVTGDLLGALHDLHAETSAGCPIPNSAPYSDSP